MFRERIQEHCGDDCEILTVRRAPRFGCHVFVADFVRGRRHIRLLGSIHEDGKIIEQSAMDLMRPERLVYLYERLMLVTFALAAEPSSALLLGLGGGAMCRHLAAYLPDCAVTLVERDPVIRDLARRYFHIAQPVAASSAAPFIAKAKAEFDVVLVDLYDAGGAAKVAPRFWADCVAALRPGGCIAINWAEFVGQKRVRSEIAAITAAMGRSFFIAERNPRPNIVQFAPTERGFRLDKIESRLANFAHRHNLPREDRDILKKCAIGVRYPAD